MSNSQGFQRGMAAVFGLFQAAMMYESRRLFDRLGPVQRSNGGTESHGPGKPAGSKLAKRAAEGWKCRGH